MQPQVRVVSVTEFVNPRDHQLRTPTPSDLNEDSVIKFFDRIVFYPGENPAYPKGAFFDYPSMFHPATGVVVFAVGSDDCASITLAPGSVEYDTLKAVLTADLKPGINEAGGIRINNIGANPDFTSH